MSVSFDEMGLDPRILQALHELEFEKPTEVQQKTIPALLPRKRDIIALAQTGTGKTAAFGLPILSNIDTEASYTQALVIAPTRELCLQIAEDLKKFSKYMLGLRISAVYGGSSVSAQIKELKAGSHIVVATPGRLIDLIERRAVKIQQVNTVVLDEADEMLNMGFRDDMEAILAHTPENKITALFSATMSKEIRSIASSYLSDPEEITIGKKNTVHGNITHQYAVVHAKDKLAALKRIIDFHEDFYGIVFCNTKLETQEISDHLVKEGFQADCLHGDLVQAQRDKVMSRFRQKLIKVLMATDVAARGIDVKNLTHIIHYHLPADIENYTHRSGRTARAGQKGISIALLHIREAYKLHQIERTANVKFERYLIPKGEEVIGARIKKFIDSFALHAGSSKIQMSFPNEWIYPLMQMSKDQLVQGLLAIEFKKLMHNYASAPDINVDEKIKIKYASSAIKLDSKPKHKSTGSDRKMETSAKMRMYINLGKKDKIKYDEMREIIFRATKISGRLIRAIEMKNVFSFFMTDKETAIRLSRVKSAKYQGRLLKILPATELKV